MRERPVKTNKMLEYVKKEGTHTFLNQMWMLYKKL